MPASRRKIKAYQFKNIVVSCQILIPSYVLDEQSLGFLIIFCGMNQNRATILVLIYK